MNANTQKHIVHRFHAESITKAIENTTKYPAYNDKLNMVIRAYQHFLIFNDKQRHTEENLYVRTPIRKN